MSKKILLILGTAGLMSMLINPTKAENCLSERPDISTPGTTHVSIQNPGGLAAPVITVGSARVIPGGRVTVEPFPPKPEKTFGPTYSFPFTPDPTSMFNSVITQVMEIFTFTADPAADKDKSAPAKPKTCPKDQKKKLPQKPEPEQPPVCSMSSILAGRSDLFKPSTGVTRFNVIGVKQTALGDHYLVIEVSSPSALAKYQIHIKNLKPTGVIDYALEWDNNTAATSILASVVAPATDTKGDAGRCNLPEENFNFTLIAMGDGKGGTVDSMTRSGPSDGPYSDMLSGPKSNQYLFTQFFKAMKENIFGAFNQGTGSNKYVEASYGASRVRVYLGNGL